MNNKSFVTLSDKATQRLARILVDEPDNSALRVAVEGGGCSGFSYIFDITDVKNDDDFVIDQKGALVYIDKTSMPFMIGSVIDFVDDLVGKSFRVNNPNATANCGCGTSFSI